MACCQVSTNIKQYRQVGSSAQYLKIIENTQPSQGNESSTNRH